MEFIKWNTLEMNHSKFLSHWRNVIVYNKKIIVFHLGTLQWMVMDVIILSVIKKSRITNMIY